MGTGLNISAGERIQCPGHVGSILKPYKTREKLFRLWITLLGSTSMSSQAGSVSQAKTQMQANNKGAAVFF